MTVNEDIQKSVISHAVYIEKYKSGVVNQMLNQLEEANQVFQEALAAILVQSEIAGETSPQLLEQRIAALISERDRNLRAIADSLKQELLDFTEYETGFIIGMLDENIPVAIDYVKPPPEQVYSAAIARPFEGVLLSDALDKFISNDADLIQSTIKNGYLVGQTTAEIVKVLEASTQTKNQLTALTKTALQHHASVASEEVFEANDDVISRLQWISTLDTRTTPICRDRDGRTWEINDASRPEIPAHWQCRSRYSPITKSWEELGIDLDDIDEGTRASMNGQVPASMDYEAWLRSQPVEIQMESFKNSYTNWQEKYALWSSGGLTVSEFVDTLSGHEYTLDELRALQPEAFENE